MEYIVIPSKSKSETAFFLDILKKRHKDVYTISSEKLEEITFVAALKEAEKIGKGSLSKVKNHLFKIVDK